MGEWVYEGNGCNGSVIAILIHCMCDGRHEGVTVVIRQKGVLRSSMMCDERSSSCGSVTVVIGCDGRHSYKICKLCRFGSFSSDSWLASFM